MKSETWKRFQEASTKLLPRLALLAALATWFFGFFLQKVVPQEMAVHGLIVALFVTLWFMLVSTQSTQEASEATRDTLIPSESQHLLQNVSTIHLFGFSRRDDIFSSAKELKMAAINFFGLKEYRSLLTTCAVENKTEIQIALLKPGSAAFIQHMLDSESDERRDELCQDAVNVLMTLASIQKAIDDANKKKRNTVPAVKLFYYTKSAHCGLVITDSVIRYWPYLHSTDVVDSPALDYPRNSAYAEYYERHFEAIKAEPTTLDDAEKLARDWLRNWRERISKNAEQSVGHGAADNAGSNG